MPTHRRCSVRCAADRRPHRFGRLQGRSESSPRGQATPYPQGPPPCETCDPTDPSCAETWMGDTVKFLLSEREIPTQWINLMADLDPVHPPPPPLHPGT